MKWGEETMIKTVGLKGGRFRTDSERIHGCDKPQRKTKGAEPIRQRFVGAT